MRDAFRQLAAAPGPWLVIARTWRRSAEQFGAKRGLPDQLCEFCQGLRANTARSVAKVAGNIRSTQKRSGIRE
jgi:hypothetical protein